MEGRLLFSDAFHTLLKNHHAPPAPLSQGQREQEQQEDKQQQVMA